MSSRDRKNLADYVSVLLLYLAMYLKWQAKEEEEGRPTDWLTEEGKKKILLNLFWLQFKREQKGAEKECAKTQGTDDDDVRRGTRGRF